MDWKKYDYTVTGKTPDLLSPRPLIEVCFENKTGRFPVLAMLDSGTDSTVANAEIAEALHISPNTCRPAKLGGIGGEKQGFVCEIDIHIPDFDLTMHVPVIFIKDPAFDVLLGQLHFFKNFKIRFEKAHDVFYVQKEVDMKV